MTLYDLINKCDIKKVCEFWDKEYKNIYEFDEYPSYNIPGYIDYLKTLKPCKTEYTLIVEMETDEFSDGPYVHIYGVKPDSTENWAMELSDNEEWLSFPIINRLDCNDDELLAHLLWEMSFMGWYNEQRQEMKEDIDIRSKEVEKWIAEGTIEEHTVSLDDIKAKFDK